MKSILKIEIPLLAERDDEICEDCVRFTAFVPIEIMGGKGTVPICENGNEACCFGGWGSVWDGARF